MYFSGGVQAQTSPDTADDQFDLEEFVTLESLCHPTVQDALTDSSDTTPETMHESLDDRSRLVLSPTTQSPDDPSNEIHLQPYQLPVRKNRGIPKIQYEADPKAKVKYPISNHVSTHRLSAPHAMLIKQLDSLSTPSSVEEALMDPNWKQAMNDEMQALQKNSTWELVPLPSGKRTMDQSNGTKLDWWQKDILGDMEWIIGRRLLQVAKINTVRILISLAANLDWPLHQFDVKNAFLHGDLEEEVYMDPPHGCKLSSESKHHVCKLKKSLYGLKQSPRAWFGRLTKSMRAFGYKQSNFDHTLFLKHKENKITALIVYVDDMIVTGDDPDERKALQEYLSKEFEMKDLGTLKYFLGIEVSRSHQGIFLSQRKYVMDLLTETRMMGCKPVNTPMEENHKLGECTDHKPTNKEQYQRLVGRLIYLSHTRPDIAYAVSVVSQFMHSPSEVHRDAVNRILRYLKSTPGKGLMYSKQGHPDVIGYTDADWAGSQTDDDPLRVILLL
ncbi:unnamed protein product [Prunus brigantina]